MNLFCPVRVCSPCPTGTTCCGTCCWGTCICYRPTFGECCVNGPDLVCEGQNAACIALKTPLEEALKLAERAVDEARGVLDAAEAALIPLRAAVDAAQVVVDGAEAALEGVKQAFAVGLEAANAIANFGLNGLISIREISFNANLDVAAGGSFSGSVRAVFAGAAEVTVSININLHDITSMAKQLADRIGNSFSSLF